MALVKGIQTLCWAGMHSNITTQRSRRLFLIIPDLACVAGNPAGLGTECWRIFSGMSWEQSDRTKGPAPAVTLGGNQDGSVTLDLLYLDLGLLVPLSPPAHIHTHKLEYSYRSAFHSLEQALSVLVQTSRHGD